MTNKAAASLARSKWAKKTAAERKAHGRMMAEARWAKEKAGDVRKHGEFCSCKNFVGLDERAGVEAARDEYRTRETSGFASAVRSSKPTAKPAKKGGAK